MERAPTVEHRPPRRPAGHRLAAVSVALVLAAPGCGPDRMSIDMVTPAVVSTLHEVTVAVRGRGFVRGVEVRIDKTSTARIADEFEARIGTTRLPAGAARRIDDQNVEITVPSGLPVGHWDLALRGPTGSIATLVDGIEVVDEPVGLPLSIESAPDGLGTALPAQTIASGSRLTVYAVARTETGQFVGNAPVEWALEIDQDPPVDLGVLSDASGTTTTLQPRAAGSGRIVARSRRVAGLAAVSVTVTPGAPIALRIDSGPPGVGSPVGNVGAKTTDDVIELWAIALDAAGNPVVATPVTWQVIGPIGVLGPGLSEAVTLDLVRPGTGSVRATSATLGQASTGTISVMAGRAATLSISPDTATLSADDPPMPFSITALDADGNPTTELGTVTWSIASGPISAIDPSSGVLNPAGAGRGTVRATSSLGLSAESGQITINPGRVATLSMYPTTLLTGVGENPTAFYAAGIDADGNQTLDLGTLTWAISSGPISSIDPATGLFSPLTQGAGTVRVSSSYGLFRDSGNVTVVGNELSIVAVSVPSDVVPGQAGVRVDVTVQNQATQPVPLTGGWLTFARGIVPVDSEFAWSPLASNGTSVPALGTADLLFDVDVSLLAALGTTNLTAHVSGLVPTRAALVSATRTTSLLVVSGVAPEAIISAPVAPQNRLCTGDTTSFDGASSTGTPALSWSWDLQGGAPATSTAAQPASIQYAAAGAYPFELAVTDGAGRSARAEGPAPVFVGTASVTPSMQHPTGTIRFAAPTPGQQIKLTTLPSTAYLDMAAADGLRQCDGSSLSAGAAGAWVTLFVDRGVINPAQDILPSLPGIQVPLSASGEFNDVELLPSSPALEGPALAYAEHARSSDGAVTAAGWVSFAMTNDRVQPTVVGTIPAADCGPPCVAKGMQWWFLFSEPMDPASLSSVVIEAGPADSACGDPSPFVDISGASSQRYDASARALIITPAPQPIDSYKVRVRLAGGIRDASSNSNQLLPLSRCATVGPAPPPAPPSAPGAVSVSPDPFSPDGDQTDDTTTFSFTPAADTHVVTIELVRAGASVATLTARITSSGPQSLAWDGRDYLGRIVRNGSYGYRIVAYNSTGAVTPPLQGVVRVASAPSFVGLPGAP